MTTQAETHTALEEAIRELKKATSRVKHARAQVNRYPNSQGSAQYLTDAKARWRVAFAAVHTAGDQAGLV